MKREERNNGKHLRYEDEGFDYLQRNLQRAQYAQERFDNEGIRYIRPSQDSDRFIIFGKGRNKYQFYAGTGLILGPYEERGIEQMISIAVQGRNNEVRESN